MFYYDFLRFSAIKVYSAQPHMFFLICNDANKFSSNRSYSNIKISIHLKCQLKKKNSYSSTKMLWCF